jgi:hypothetical protein
LAFFAAILSACASYGPLPEGEIPQPIVGARVNIWVDASYQDAYLWPEAWQEEIKRAFGAASKEMRKEIGVKLETAEIKRWDADPLEYPKDIFKHLADFQAATLAYYSPEDYKNTDFFILIAAREIGKSRAMGAAFVCGKHAIVNLIAPNEIEEFRLVHEIYHLLCASHAKKPNSVMYKTPLTFRLDPENKKIVLRTKMSRFVFRDRFVHAP